MEEKARWRLQLVPTHPIGAPSDQAGPRGDKKPSAQDQVPTGEGQLKGPNLPLLACCDTWQGGRLAHAVCMRDTHIQMCQLTRTQGTR